MGRPKGKRPEAYKTKKPDNTGKQDKENLLLKSFWKDHTVKDMMELTNQELETVADNFLTAYVAVQLSRNKKWNFPNHGA